MKRNVLLLSAAFLILGFGTSKAFADPTLQELAFDLGGTSYDSGLDSTFTADVAALGVDLSAYNSSTGLGTITYTYNPGAAGPGYFNAFWDEEVGTPFYNEFGSASGTAASGESWEIGDSFNSSIYTDASSGALLNSNLLPEGSSNFLTTCYRRLQWRRCHSAR
jgi:hypothetical protein